MKSKYTISIDDKQKIVFYVSGKVIDTGRFRDTREVWTLEYEKGYPANKYEASIHLALVLPEIDICTKTFIPTQQITQVEMDKENKTVIIYVLKPYTA